MHEGRPTGLLAPWFLMLALGAMGCEAICEQDGDCREGRACLEGICARAADAERRAPTDRAVPPPDEPETATPELGVVDAAPPDVGVDAAQPDAGPPDMTPPRRAPAFGPDGDCFGGAEEGRLSELDPSPGPAHAPQVGCSSVARAWTAVDEDGGLRVAWDIDGDSVAEGSAPLVGRYALDDRHLWIPMPEADGARLYRLDPLARDPLAERLPIFPGEGDARDPVVGGGRAAVRVAGPDGDAVAVVRGAIAETCDAPDRPRWGAALVGDRVAWFEQQPPGQLTRLVVVDDADDCAASPRRVHHLRRAIPPETRLHAADGALVWLVPNAGGTNRIWSWRVGDLGAEPSLLPAEIDGNPLALTALGRWLGVNTYAADRTPRYQLQQIDLTGLPCGQPSCNRERSGTLNSRHPSLSGRYLVWTALGDGAPWEMYYVRLR